MNAIINANFNGLNVTFRNDAYLNATAIVKQYNKQPRDYLKTEQTQEYLTALAQNLSTKTKILVNENQLVTVQNGGNNRGTWLHPKLAIHFARWLDAKFAVWCDEQIENILHKLTGDHITEYTTADERTGLRQAVDALVGKHKLLYPDAYKMIHQRFNITHIDELTAEQVEQATEYVHRLMLSQDSNDVSDQNMQIVISHFDWCHSWFTYHEPAIRAFNPKTASAITEHFDTAWVYLRDIAKTTGVKLLNRERMRTYPWHESYYEQQRFKEFESVYLS